jgi:hypothetical protein
MTTTAAGTSSIPLTQIVWNALGATLMDSVPTSMTVVWKSKNSTTHPPPSLEACQEAVGLGFQTLCQSVVQELVSANTKEASFVSPSLDELEILVHSLVSSSALCASTAPLIQGLAPPLLEDIRQALGNLPKQPETAIAETTKSDSDDDDDNDGHKEKKRKSPRNLAASRTQKVLKQFTLLLSATNADTSSNVTSKTD